MQSFRCQGGKAADASQTAPGYLRATRIPVCRQIFPRDGKQSKCVGKSYKKPTVALISILYCFLLLCRQINNIYLYTLKKSLKSFLKIYIGSSDVEWPLTWETSWIWLVFSSWSMTIHICCDFSGATPDCCGWETQAVHGRTKLAQQHYCQGCHGNSLSTA